MTIRTGERIGLFALLLLCALAPLFMRGILPLNDYPAHLARMYILVGGDASPFLSEYYAIQWAPIPNLAMDLIVPALARIMPVEWAMVAFTALSLGLLASGVIAANWALFRTRSLLPFAVFLLLYNRQFLWGALSYLFAVGLGFWAFAAWIYLRDRPWLERLVLFTVLSLGLFFCHILAFGAYALIVIGYELSRSFRREKAEKASGIGGLWVAVGQLLPVVIALIVLSSIELTTEPISFRQIPGRVIGLFDPFLNYVTLFDLFTGAVLGLIVLAGLLTRRLVFHPCMLIPVGLLTLAYWLLPDVALGVYGAGRRTIIPLVLTGLVAMDVRIHTALWRSVWMVTLAGLFLVRMGIVAENWRAADTEYADLLSLLETMEQGGRLYGIYADVARPVLKNPPLQYLHTMAVVKKDALVNSLFPDPSRQLVRYRGWPDGSSPPPESEWITVDDSGRERFNLDVFEGVDPKTYQYVLIINPDYLSMGPLPPHVSLLGSVRKAKLFRVIAPSTR